MRNHIEFILNGQVRTIKTINPTLTVLRYLREKEGLTGTKEGCAEGDCGACTAVQVSLEGGRLLYRAVNTCIQFVATLDGKALITIEYLRRKTGDLHPVQQAMVDNHGSQCGFCTPGFVMSIFAGYQNGWGSGRREVDDLLAGNLCRCTGYGPIIKAAQSVFENRKSDSLADLDKDMNAQLDRLPRNDSVHMTWNDWRYQAPTSTDELSDILLDHPDATLLSGGTDVGLWVTKSGRKLTNLVYLGNISDLGVVAMEQDGLRIGAAASYAQALPSLAGLYPDIGDMIRRFGSVQVRNLGTIGGNIANGSPIGDMPPALIAAKASLILRCGENRRSLPLEEYFIEYGHQVLLPSEFIEAILVPMPEPDAVFKCYKVSKRFDQDISALCAAFNIRFDGTPEEQTVTEARICFGGMAGTPLRARKCEAYLLGKPWRRATIELAMEQLASDFTPISDWRASAEYRTQAAAGLLERYFLETTSGRAFRLESGQEVLDHA